MRVEFHFDFGSPNAYLCHRVIPEIESRTGTKFEYVPVLLGGVFKLTGNISPTVAQKGIRNKPEYEALEMRRFISRHGIEDFRMNPHFPVNTLAIMRGAIVARTTDCFEQYIDGIYRFMWSDPRKMDDLEIIRGSLIECSLDADAILEGLKDPKIKAELVRSTEASVARGNFGSPSFFVEDELFFGKDRLDAVEREIVSRTRYPLSPPSDI